MFSKTIQWISYVLLVQLLIACGEQAKPESQAKQHHAEQTQKPVALQDAIREEIYGDPQIFSEPRVQFLAYLKGERKSTLWSMKLDGSDRRLAADRQLLFGGDTVTHKPVRSPDNRFVAFSMDGKTGMYRGIVDLKEKTYLKISDGGGYPYFNWTADSENLIFYADGKHYNYHIPSKNLTKRPIIYSSGLFLLPGDKEFLAMKWAGFWIHEFDAKVKRKIHFDFPEEWNIKRPIVSGDGKYLFFYTDGGDEILCHWASIETGELLGSEPTETFMKTGRYPIFDIEPATLRYRYADSVRRLNLLTREFRDEEMKEIYIWTMRGEHHLSLINTRTHRQ